MPNTTASVSLSPVIFAVATTPERRILERSNVGVHGATLLQTGIGPRQVRAMAAAIVTHKPAGLISIGTAGALAPELPPGRLLLPLSLVTENGPVFQVAPAWHARVRRRLTGHHIETGAIVSVDQAVLCPDHKQQLAAHTGAIAVDMESVELARIAMRHSIPFLVVRAVADPVNQQLPLSAVAALTSRGNLHVAGLLAQLLRRPGEITGLIRLNANFRAAGRTLDACCRVAGEQMCAPGR